MLEPFYTVVGLFMALVLKDIYDIMFKEHITKFIKKYQDLFIKQNKKKVKKLNQKTKKKL
jgi:hypothetical protein